MAGMVQIVYESKRASKRTIDSMGIENDYRMPLAT
jgi:hypothetical protein